MVLNVSTALWAGMSGVHGRTSHWDTLSHTRLFEVRGLAPQRERFHEMVVAQRHGSCYFMVFLAKATSNCPDAHSFCFLAMSTQTFSSAGPGPWLTSWSQHQCTWAASEPSLVQAGGGRLGCVETARWERHSGTLKATTLSRILHRSRARSYGLFVGRGSSIPQ